MEIISNAFDIINALTKTDIYNINTPYEGVYTHTLPPMLKDNIAVMDKHEHRLHSFLNGLTKIIVEQHPLKKRE
jgi:hypothetical protein